MKQGLLENVTDSTLERFWSKVDKSGDCWLWLAGTDTFGYGCFGVRTGLQTGAHQFSFALAYGQQPLGTVICHRCDVPGCVRPDHLFAGTHADNVRDMVAKGRQATGARLNWPPQKGERNNAARLSEELVAEIRRRNGNGETQTALAKELGLNRSSVSAVVRGRTWGHIAGAVKGGVRTDNTSGVRGVHWDKRAGVWVARITIRGVHRWLGGFKTKEEAVAARRRAELERESGEGIPTGVEER